MLSQLHFSVEWALSLSFLLLAVCLVLHRFFFVFSLLFFGVFFCKASFAQSIFVDLPYASSDLTLNGDIQNTAQEKNWAYLQSFVFLDLQKKRYFLSSWENQLLKDFLFDKKKFDNQDFFKVVVSLLQRKKQELKGYMTDLQWLDLFEGQISNLEHFWGWEKKALKALIEEKRASSSTNSFLMDCHAMLASMKKMHSFIREKEDILKEKKRLIGSLNQELRSLKFVRSDVKLKREELFSKIHFLEKEFQEKISNLERKIFHLNSDCKFLKTKHPFFKSFKSNEKRLRHVYNFLKMKGEERIAFWVKEHFFYRHHFYAKEILGDVISVSSGIVYLFAWVCVLLKIKSWEYDIQLKERVNLLFRIIALPISDDMRTQVKLSIKNKVNIFLYLNLMGKREGFDLACDRDIDENNSVDYVLDNDAFKVSLKAYLLSNSSRFHSFLFRHTDRVSWREDGVIESEINHFIFNEYLILREWDAARATFDRMSSLLTGERDVRPIDLNKIIATI